MLYREAPLLPRWRYSCHSLFAGAGISIHESRFLSPLLPRLGISCRCGFRSVLKSRCAMYMSIQVLSVRHSLYYLSWLCNHYRQPAFKWWESCCLKNDWDPGQCSSHRPPGDWSDRWSLSIVQRVASTLARKSGLGEANQAPKQNMLYPSCLHVISLHAILLHSGNPTTCHEIPKPHPLLYTQTQRK
jgi:hypothetical protein